MKRPPVIKAVAVDESHAWTEFDEYLRPKGVDRMLGVYLTLDNVDIHICSLTPSIEAHFAENVPVFYPPWRTVDGNTLPQVPHEDRDEVHDYVMGANVDEWWTYFSRHSKFHEEEDFDSPRAMEVYEELFNAGEDPYSAENRAKIMEAAYEDYREAPAAFA